MFFFPTFINLYVLIVCLLSETSFAVDSHYQNCSVPKSCGGQNISFPFYIPGLQEDYCGFPGFQLSCNDNEEGGYPTLQLAGNEYLVHNINYQNRTLVVSNAALSNSNKDVCIPLVQNITFPTVNYALVPNQKEIVLLYCNSSLVDESFLEYKIGCFEQSSRTTTTTSILALPRDDDQLFDDVSDKCGRKVVAVAPVEESVSNVGNELGVADALRRGFMLKWLASDCSRCRDSGGKCGFDFKTYHFSCFCPDRPHAVSCKGAGGLMILVLVVVCCFRRKLSDKSTFFWMNKNQSHQIVPEFLMDYGPLQVQRYSYLDVKKMTNSFEEKLGQGGYGGVYKGKLNNGFLVAVKILNRSKGNGEEFMNEVAAISRTSHVNIVSLLGFCFEGSERALIYEFMPNGSLEKFIFDANNPRKDHHLGWEALDRIALGIARGLEYLHRGCNTRILHFDIKPHNILLNEDFAPKISDFGLAKICNGKESIVSMMGARGTAGYIAPEVFCRNFGGISHKSDVYSYGMMLSEMVGGRRKIGVEVEDTSEIYFPQWIYKRLELDQELGLQRIMNEEDKGRARKMIIVSLWCIQTDPSSRPAMKQVIEMLEGSIGSLQIPPKPYLYSPPKSLAEPAHPSSTLVSLQ
ncbi:putative glycerophosphodiester phosphodiesterase, protein kinase RLK-Pelle-LRK10L-2 family [Rosa chinensis]|uniref:non-specific serine/threonine protein kinase n=1 Tax=Rosa chinensis TaxID=74649 RepID=A0A2P6R1M3_ROSCH|nr:putative glycerophosphodiester phosphodiesterase, protein kinase RLK-Pelle-LRK10L-2 family [Rosa chinensis]